MLQTSDEQFLQIADLLNVDIWRKATESEQKLGSQTFALVEAVINAKLAPYQIDEATAAQMREATVKALMKEFMKILPEKIITPKLRHIGTSIERIIECDSDDEDMRRHYACMVAAAMHTDTVEKYHPAFPSVLAQLSKEDLKIVSGYSVSSAPSRHIFFCKVHLPDGGYAENLAHRTFISQGASWREVGMFNSVDYLSNLSRLSIVNSIRSEKEWSLHEFAMFLKKNDIVTEIVGEGEHKYLVDRGIDVVVVHEQIDLFPLSRFGYEFVRACGIF